MPALTGRVEVNLSVRDPAGSAAWYDALLGLRQRYDFTSPDGGLRYICLEAAEPGIVLCLVGHVDNPGEPFDERRTGLDHLEFLVPTRADLDEWAGRLDTLGIPHSGIKEPGHTANAMITFRDPDGIQLEFFCRAAVPPGT